MLITLPFQLKGTPSVQEEKQVIKVVEDPKTTTKKAYTTYHVELQQLPEYTT